MTVETQETTRTQAATRPGADEELLREVPIIASKANDLVFPALYAAAISLAAGGVFWFLCFSHYLFDSFKSAFLCLGVLAAIATPGCLILRLHQALKALRELPARVPGVRAVEVTRAMVAKPAAAETKGIARFIAPLRSWFGSLLELRDHLSFAEENLAKVAGMKVWVALLINPFQTVLMGIAGAVSVFLVVMAVLAVVLTGFRALVS